MTPGRALTLWGASFLLAASVLICFFHAPLGPLLIAGVVTGLGTVLRSLYTQRRSR